LRVLVKLRIVQDGNLRGVAKLRTVQDYSSYLMQIAVVLVLLSASYPVSFLKSAKIADHFALDQCKLFIV
jgi:hypothetical protein